MHVVYLIEPDDYQAFRAIIGNDETLPETFEAWRESNEQHLAKIAAAGQRVEKVVIKPHKFAAWCRASGLGANIESLGAFAVAQNRVNADDALKVGFWADC